jgi:hypothetical protein
LNYGHLFLPLHDWDLLRACERVKLFIQAANNSEFNEIKCLIDDINPSAEAAQKWKTRREKEVKKGMKKVPQGFAILLGDMFRSCDIEVLYSDELDNDDTLACYAHADEAILLSGDKDFFRYTDAKYVVYDGCHVTKDLFLVLSQFRTAETIDYKGKQPNAIDIGEPPRTRGRVTQISNGIYKRGVPTALMQKLLVSPHRILAPLRHAAFHVIDIRGPITETYPYWYEEAETVEWHYEGNIFPREDAFHQNLLANSEAAMKHFFPQESSRSNGQTKSAWDRHVFCVQSLLYEIISFASQVTDKPVTLLELWLLHINTCKKTSIEGNKKEWKRRN